MTADNTPEKARKPFSHPHRRRSLANGLILLAVIIAVMVLLPRLTDLLAG